MTAGNFGKAYEAYQQAVYRDGKNPAFWCSIGVLYCNINQFHDSLDAYSRAIRINPYLSEVWFNLGALYESCNDQMNDAVDAYQRTLQLDQGNAVVQARLDEIRAHRTQGTPLTAPPPPRDISPSSQSWQYAAHTNGPPNGFAAEGAEQAEQNGVAGPAHQLHGGPPPPQHHPSHQPGPQYPSNGHANGHGPMPPQPCVNDLFFAKDLCTDKRTGTAPTAWTQPGGRQAVPIRRAEAHQLTSNARLSLKFAPITTAIIYTIVTPVLPYLSITSNLLLTMVILATSRPNICAARLSIPTDLLLPTSLVLLKWALPMLTILAPGRLRCSVAALLPSLDPLPSLRTLINATKIEKRRNGVGRPRMRRGGDSSRRNEGKYGRLLTPALPCRDRPLAAALHHLLPCAPRLHLVPLPPLNPLRIHPSKKRANDLQDFRTAAAARLLRERLFHHRQMRRGRLMRITMRESIRCYRLRIAVDRRQLLLLLRDRDRRVPRGMRRRRRKWEADRVA